MNIRRLCSSIQRRLVPLSPRLLVPSSSHVVVIFLVLCLTACAALKDRLPPPEPVDNGIKFQYEDPSAWRVEVAGQFNDWKTFPDQKSIQMKKDENGIWTAVIPFRQNAKGDQVYVEYGKRYQYKVVINGTSWIEDPNNTLKSTEAGITNSLIIVPERQTPRR